MQLGGALSRFMSESSVHVCHQCELFLYPLVHRLSGLREQTPDQPVTKPRTTQDSREALSEAANLAHWSRKNLSLYRNMETRRTSFHLWRWAAPKVNTKPLVRLQKPGLRRPRPTYARTTSLPKEQDIVNDFSWQCKTQAPVFTLSSKLSRLHLLCQSEHGSAYVRGSWPTIVASDSGTKSFVVQGILLIRRAEQLSESDAFIQLDRKKNSLWHRRLLDTYS